MKIESVKWCCYRVEATARQSFNLLKEAQLGGPGKVELRHNSRVPYGWWVVLHNIVCGTSHDLVRVYGIPPANEGDSWFPYEGMSKLNQNTQASTLIDSFDVEATRAGLSKAAEEMPDGYYLCEPNVKCREEANKRLASL